MSRNSDPVVRALSAWLESVMQESIHRFLGYARERGLSMSQVGALMFVHRHGECGMADVVDDLGVSNAAGSQLMDRLVQNGYVIRTEDQEDRRAKRLALTPAGERIVREAVESRRRWLTELAGSLTKAEREDTIRTAELLTEKTDQLARRNQ